MRFHLIALPNVQTTKAYSLDGFCGATIKMARMLKSLGHTVFLYASEENEAPCDELITVITKEEQQTILGEIPYQYAGFFGQQCFPIWALAGKRTIKAIEARKQPHDFILIIGGGSQADIATAHRDLMTVEYSIGYISQFSDYRVYESHVWRAMSTGKAGSEDGRFFDDVIPLYYDPAEHPYRERADEPPFALYVGRFSIKKGIVEACRAAKVAGIPLKVIGHGDASILCEGAEYLGAVGQDERNDWMSRASVLIAPTLYIEPFGGVSVEAQMAGTPVVASAFGGFVETVEHGKTGFLCNYLGEFAEGLRQAPALDRAYIHERALERYSMDVIKYAYQRYFERLMLLWDAAGWNSTEPTPPQNGRRQEQLAC